MMKKTKKPLIYQSTALKLLGLPKAKVDKLKLKPEREAVNPYYSTAPKSKLYDRLKIEKLIDSPKVNALKPKPRKSIDHTVKFKKKYPAKQDAILDAAQAMFNLNRYTKHKSCSAKNRAEIYDIKNIFVEFLYKSGFCKTCYMHHFDADEKDCYACNATGVHFDRLGDMQRCKKCSGTGIYQKGGRIEFVVFSFDIDNNIFTWHQPRESVDFDFTVTEEGGELNETLIKSIEMSKSKFAEAKALVKWVAS